MKVKNDRRSKFSNLNSGKKNLKKIRASTGFEPVTSAIPVSYEASHWERGQFIEFISSREE